MAIQFPQRYCVENHKHGCVCSLMDCITRSRNHQGDYSFRCNLDICREEGTVNDFDSTGITPLIRATAYNHKWMVLQLIQARGDVNLATRKAHEQIPLGSTPLWISLQVTHNIAMAQLLIQSGAKTTIDDSLDEIGKQHLMRAKKGVEEEQEAMALVFFSDERYLPKPLVRLSIEYLGNSLR